MNNFQSADTLAQEVELISGYKIDFRELPDGKIFLHINGHLASMCRDYQELCRSLFAMRRLAKLMKEAS